MLHPKLFTHDKWNSAFSCESQVTPNKWSFFHTRKKDSAYHFLLNPQSLLHWNSVLYTKINRPLYSSLTHESLTTSKFSSGEVITVSWRTAKLINRAFSVKTVVFQKAKQMKVCEQKPTHVSVLGKLFHMLGDFLLALFSWKAKSKIL